MVQGWGSRKVKPPGMHRNVPGMDVLWWASPSSSPLRSQLVPEGLARFSNGPGDLIILKRSEL